MKQYTIYCSEKQANKALELGAPIKVAECLGDLINTQYNLNEDKKTAILIPTAEQMIIWLEEQGFNFEITKSYAVIEHDKVGTMGFYEGTRKETTLMVIDDALEYLSYLVNNDLLV